MKKSFAGYYSPNANELEQLWKEALIVLDTNVLLSLYRLPKTASDEVLKVLEILKNRIWIPHQVALEFQRQRLNVIGSERKATDSAISTTTKMLDEIKNLVEKLQLEKRDLDIKPELLLEKFDSAHKELAAALEKTHKAQLDISASDPIRERLDDLFDGRVGVGPSDQAQLDKLIEGGEHRYAEKIPPGFSDIDKEKNPNEASLIFDHIKIPRKFGDLILWRQLIERAKDSNSKKILFVTEDQKEDWWRREQGKTVGPHPELVREIKRDGGVELFWMYSSVQFVEHANRFLKAEVSQTSVDDIRQVALDVGIKTRHSRKWLDENKVLLSRENVRDDLIVRSTRNRFFVKEWLRKFGEVQDLGRGGFPDFVLREQDKVRGYGILFLDNFLGRLMGVEVTRFLYQGFKDVERGNLNDFTLVIVIPDHDFYLYESKQMTDYLTDKLIELCQRVPSSSIVIGSIIDEAFEILVSCLTPHLLDDQDPKSLFDGTE